ncbi:hypothetical protein GGI11_000499 [Coemansia sp. RSA 2049]|nr:hypothetical protein GGI11_000499 [Coemansia sp. RSA 2049]
MKGLFVAELTAKTLCRSGKGTFDDDKKKKKDKNNKNSGSKDDDDTKEDSADSTEALPNYRDIIKLAREGATIHDIAYVAQEAWLRNATIRENILFGEPYDLERYEEVLRICALKPDLRILAAGDMSEVGERGIALSGGQKQRVALARAVYSSRPLIESLDNKNNESTAKQNNNNKKNTASVNDRKSEDEYNKEHLQKLAVKQGIDPNADLSMLQGILIKDEEREIGYVKFEVWKTFMKTDNEMNMTSIERIMQYTRTEQEASNESDSQNKPPATWPNKGDLQIDNLAVEYVPGVSVLHDISFSVGHGEKVGVVGRTGAGKSTISLALLRFLEASKGQIVLDGVDISKIGLEDLRRNVSIIPQDPVLFNGTIRFNLDPFDEHPDELLWEALRRTHLVRETESQVNSTASSTANANNTENKDVVALERMAGIFTTLDAEIKENGNNLSAGQRQLVALARALIRRSKLIIMDEATASVDFDTDRRIQNTIQGPEFANSTLLCIAHRLRTVLDCDKVLVLDNGRVAEYDTPHNLLQIKNGIFRSMCKEAGEYKRMIKAEDSKN